MRCFRLDYGVLGAVERTPQGGIRVPATLTRTGVFEYSAPNGKVIREYRPPTEVSRADSLATLRAAPLTLDHPPVKIDPTNYRTYATGHVGDDVKMDGANVSATVHIQDLSAIRAIEAGRRELSCGYHCDVDEQPGIVPNDDPFDAGKPYDRVQRNIQYNHLAFVDDGRAGNARLRLDSSGHSIYQGENEMEKVEVIEGTEYTVGTPAHGAAVQRRDAKEKQAREEIASLKSDRDKQQARADAAEAKLSKATAWVKEKLTPARMDAAVARRAAIVEKARAVMGKDWKIDKADGAAKSNAEIKAEVVAKVYPGVRLDGKSKDYVNAMWDSLTSEAVKGAQVRNDGLDKLLRETAPMPGAGGATLRTDSGAPVGSVRQARHDAFVESGERAHRPLALSRRDKFKPLSSSPMLQSAQMETMK